MIRHKNRKWPIKLLDSREVTNEIAGFPYLWRINTILRLGRIFDIRKPQKKEFQKNVGQNVLIILVQIFPRIIMVLRYLNVYQLKTFLIFTFENSRLYEYELYKLKLASVERIASSTLSRFLASWTFLINSNGGISCKL